MPNVSTEDVPWASFVSPKGNFRCRSREISIAPGAKRDAGPDGSGHPLDVSLEELEPGATSYPYHAHAAQ